MRATEPPRAQNYEMSGTVKRFSLSLLPSALTSSPVPALCHAVTSPLPSPHCCEEQRLSLAPAHVKSVFQSF